jgi:hypothetical protein
MRRAQRRWQNLVAQEAEPGPYRQALPLDGKLVLRTYKEQPEEREKVVKGKFEK